MNDMNLQPDSSVIVEVVRSHHRAYASGRDDFLQLLAFPLLVRRGGVTRSYSSPESYSRDAAEHRQKVITADIARLELRIEAVILLGPNIGLVRFNSLRLNRDGIVLSAHAATNVVIRHEGGWRITSIFADDDALILDTRVGSRQSKG